MQIAFNFIAFNGSTANPIICVHANSGRRERLQGSKEEIAMWHESNKFQSIQNRSETTALQLNGNQREEFRAMSGWLVAVIISNIFQAAAAIGRIQSGAIGYKTN